MTDFLSVASSAAISEGTKQAIKNISLFLASLFGEPNDAFSQWMKLQGQIRIETLITQKQQLEAENKNLKEQITDLEKLSPTSGYTRAVQEYLTTPIEDKVELLRNALLNGIYGDYTLETRENFYRLISILQPTDIKILGYLLNVCPGFKTLEEELTKHEQVTQLQRTLNPDYQSDFDKTVNNISLRKMVETFKELPLENIKSSLDRLRINGLIHNAVALVDLNDPYYGCTPLASAPAFINFLSDPRNNLLKSHQ